MSKDFFLSCTANASRILPDLWPYRGHVGCKVSYSWYVVK